MRNITNKILSLSLALSLPLSLVAFDLEQKCLSDEVQALVKPNSQYQINSDKSVSDSKSGLTWGACLYGTTGVNCVEGTPLSTNWDKAFIATTTNLDANQTDWRLPSIIELGSLVESSCNKPAINVVRFRNLFKTFKSFNEYYIWSSTTDYSNPERAYVLDVMTGKIMVKNKNIENETASFYTLLVKSSN